MFQIKSAGPSCFRERILFLPCLGASPSVLWSFQCVGKEQFYNPKENNHGLVSLHTTAMIKTRIWWHRTFPPCLESEDAQNQGSPEGDDGSSAGETPPLATIFVPNRDFYTTLPPRSLPIRRGAPITVTGYLQSPRPMATSLCKRCLSTLLSFPFVTGSVAPHQCKSAIRPEPIPFTAPVMVRRKNTGGDPGISAESPPFPPVGKFDVTALFPRPDSTRPPIQTAATTPLPLKP